MQQPTENKLGVMPVNKLLLNMSLPMIISMLIQALYNIVDSIFVAQIGEYAIRAVSLAFPIQSLMIALGAGTGVGINALLSRTLGERNREKANHVAENGVFACVACYVAFALLGVLAARPFMNSQTDVLEVREYGVTYLIICCAGSIGIFMEFAFERILQSTGRSLYTMFTQGLGAITNIILDPILIFGLFGAPKMGIAGAAAATVIGQILGAIFAILLNHYRNTDVTLRLRGFRPRMRIIREIYQVGAPSIVMQAIGALMSFGMNLILVPFGIAQTVFGLYYKLQSFVFMPAFGLNNGMVPIVAYNYGAGKRARVLHTIRLSMICAVSMMAAGTLAFELFPAQLLGMFNPTPELLIMGVPALRILAIPFIFAGFCIVCSSVFQALGNGLYSMYTSLARQLFVLLPSAYLLSLTGNINLIWLSFPIAELVSLALSLFFYARINKKIISTIRQG
ncbi:MAG: MATE family efflux transporter [Clostridia bacterium]